MKYLFKTYKVILIFNFLYIQGAITTTIHNKMKKINRII